MSQVVNKIIGYCQRHKKIAMVAFFTVVLIAFFWGFFALVPKNSIIYYSGATEDVRLDMSAKMFQIEVRDDPYNGNIKFHSDPETLDSIWAIDQGLLEKIPLDELDPKTYEDSQSFLFNDGVATLNCSNYLELTMEGPSDSYFTYSLSITRKDDGNSPQNFITIDNFPEDTIIYVRGESEIGMYGNVTDAHMDAGRYRMIGCSSITFPMCCKLSQATEDEENRHNLSDGKVQSFQFTNIERQTFEFTVDSSTEFKEIGHIRLAGTAQSEGSVTASVSDMGAYPILLTVSGNVGELSMAGHSFYLTCSQWLRTNMTSILLAIISVIFSAIIAMPSKSDN